MKKSYAIQTMTKREVEIYIFNLKDMIVNYWPGHEMYSLNQLKAELANMQDALPHCKD
jgi:hypothetical protein